ncbi:hypothetical protein LOTGIDRAFT_163386 [Lottia gigantea]|uniref:CARD domain-containing protein n=1 Tax=Lottia gigantea TaxID=225164 RepID=V4A4L6_LOTGI|nr:hypothetical protein LOTGIDRAFT_163386 [Lottia gigantea]ESO91657.1 hypothetical protein LOTGIDRAFT_163386 [Lottia gigantea]
MAENKKLQAAMKFDGNDNAKGSIPSGHNDILVKNHTSILEVKVNDIMDHLYGKKVIDENDMDVIKTKLKAEGNKEALGYILEILKNRGSRALPIFIQCLSEAKYIELAKRLQLSMEDPKDSLKLDMKVKQPQ